MDTLRSRTDALMDGPPARVPARVVEGMELRGRRVLAYVERDGRDEWARDLRAIDDPYWLDDSQGFPIRWLPGTEPPAGADPNRARLFVSVCTERGWYDWARTKRRPRVAEYPAIVVWVE